MAFVLRTIIRSNLPRHMIFSAKCMQTQTGPLYAAVDINVDKISTPTNNQASDASKNETSTKNAAQNEMKLIVSDSCIKRLREICQEGSFLRVTVEGGGCSGFQYKFDLDTKLSDDDLQFGEGKAKVVIDKISLEYCSGATIDYHTELIRSGFRMLANPKAEQGCSCGASFAIKLN